MAVPRAWRRLTHLLLVPKSPWQTNPFFNTKMHSEGKGIDLEELENAHTAYSWETEWRRKSCIKKPCYVLRPGCAGMHADLFSKEKPKGKCADEAVVRLKRPRCLVSNAGRCLQEARTAYEMQNWWSVYSCKTPERFSKLWKRKHFFHLRFIFLLGSE